jgi:hypothetical protein
MSNEESEPVQPAGSRGTVNWPLGIVGAVAGGVIGYFVFFWIAGQGYYAMMLPGAAVGLGCAALSRGESRPLGIVCAVLSLPLSLFSEWMISPFLGDENIGYFLAHVFVRDQITPTMMVLGVALAYWIGKGQPRTPG